MATYSRPHHCDRHLDQTKFNGLLPLTIAGVLINMTSSFTSSKHLHKLHEKVKVEEILVLSTICSVVSGTSQRIERNAWSIDVWLVSQDICQRRQPLQSQAKSSRSQMLQLFTMRQIIYPEGTPENPPPHTHWGETARVQPVQLFNQSCWPFKNTC